MVLFTINPSNHDGYRGTLPDELGLDDESARCQDLLPIAHDNVLEEVRPLLEPLQTIYR